MVNQNTAYDLSFYEAEEDRQVARKQTKESRLIKAERRYSITKKIADIVSVALVAGLLIAVIATNAAITDTTVKIATAREDIVQLESQRDYLNFTLESRMTLDEIESYAVNNLGMVKMDSSQKKYVELEDQNVIVKYDTTVSSKINKAIQPVLSYFMP